MEKEAAMDLKVIVAQNIYYLRTINHMTQYELGERLNYSDKAISKWERADGLPDAVVLKKMSELFGVTVDYILTEHTEQDKKIQTKPAKKLKWMLQHVVLMGVVAVALLVFIILAIATNRYHWQIFVYALPVIAIVGIVFSAMVKNKITSMLYISLLVWSILTSLFVSLLGTDSEYRIWMIFLMGVPAQLIVFLSFRIKVSIKISQKELLKKQPQDEEKE